MEETLYLLYIGTDREVVNRLMEHPRISLERVDTISLSGDTFSLVKQPDVVLCERFLPDSDGFTAYAYIRDHLSWNSVPFILVAGSYEEGLVTQARQKGLDDVYVVPLPSNEDLVSRIDFLISYRREKPYNRVDNGRLSNFKMPLSKRLFDIVVASFALLVLSPFLLLVMLAIRIESRGKVFYSSIRVGQKPFNFYKFRSMRHGAEDELKKLAKKKNQYIMHNAASELDLKRTCPCERNKDFVRCSPLLHGATYSICDTWYIEQKKKIEKSTPPFVKIVDDPRVTRVGKLIRNTSIDEIPQLINIIKGDMSIVGNRPLPLYEAEKLTSDEMARRFLAPAGLTGLWQVEKRGRKGTMSDEERKRLDIQYAELFLKNKYSLLYDMKLIIRTLPVIVQKESV
ncbi:MAG: sugar transferase [Bacteroidales bacterium]|jgi:lipopolysaccharide/colanic/teichoic acid biosynthesis glycosyltransferase